MSRGAQSQDAAGTLELQVHLQGCVGRAEPVPSASCLPHPDILPFVLTMDQGDAAYNPFSSSHVWQQTASNDGLGTYQSSLFAAPELDSKWSRQLRARTRRIISDNA